MKKPRKKGDNIIDYGTISLPLPLINKIKKSMEGTGFSSVSSYVAYILRELLASSKNKQKKPKKGIEEVKRRLYVLGYLS